MSYLSQRLKRDKSNLLFFLISLVLHLIFMLILSILTTPSPLERKSVPYNPLYLVKMNMIPLYKEDHIVKPLKSSREKKALKPAISPDIKSSVKLALGKSLPQKTGRPIKPARPSAGPEPARKSSEPSKTKVVKHTRASPKIETGEKPPGLLSKSDFPRKTDSSKTVRVKKNVRVSRLISSQHSLTTPQDDSPRSPPRKLHLDHLGKSLDSPEVKMKQTVAVMRKKSRFSPMAAPDAKPINKRKIKIKRKDLDLSKTSKITRPVKEHSLKIKRLVLAKPSVNEPLKKSKRSQTESLGKIQSVPEVNKDISLSSDIYKDSNEETLPLSSPDKHLRASSQTTGQSLAAPEVFVTEKNRISVHFKPASNKKTGMSASSVKKTSSLSISPGGVSDLPRDLPRQTEIPTVNKPTKTTKSQPAVPFTITEKKGRFPNPAKEAKKTSLVEDQAIKKKGLESYNFSGILPEDRLEPASVIDKPVVKLQKNKVPAMLAKRVIEKFAFAGVVRKRKRFRPKSTRKKKKKHQPKGDDIPLKMVADMESGKISQQVKQPVKSLRTVEQSPEAAVPLISFESKQAFDLNVMKEISKTAPTSSLKRFSSREILKISESGKGETFSFRVGFSSVKHFHKLSVSHSGSGLKVTDVWQPATADVEHEKSGIAASVNQKAKRLVSGKRINEEAGRGSETSIKQAKHIKFTTGQQHQVQAISPLDEQEKFGEKPAIPRLASLDRRTGRSSTSLMVPAVLTEGPESVPGSVKVISDLSQGKDPSQILSSTEKKLKKPKPPGGNPLKSVTLKPAPHQFLSSKPQKSKPSSTSRSSKKTTLQLAMRSNLKSRLKSFKKRLDYQHIFTKIPRRREVWISYLNNQLSQVGFIYSLAVDNRDHVWITSDGGITEFDGRQFRHFNSDNGLPAQRVYAVMVAEDNTRWFGSDHGLLVGRGQGIEMVAGTGDLHVFDIKPEGRERLWLATESGLFSYRIDRKKMTFHPHPEEGLIAYSLAVLPGEGLLVGTDRGLYRYAKKEWRLSLATSHPVDTVAVDTRKRLWYGTESGGGRFDGKKWVDLGLPDRSETQTIYKLVRSSEGGVWMGTARGVGYFLGHKWKLYGRESGLVGKEVYAMASNGKGEWWFATDKGVSKLIINY